VIRALLMDADGVLQRPAKGFLSDFAELGDGWGFVKDIFTQELRTMTGVVDLADVLAEVIENRGLSITPEEVIALWCRIDPDPAMLDLVARARAAGVITVLATNQQSYRGGWMQQNLPYADYFDHTFYSFEVGLAKPDVAYFQHITDTLGVAPAEAVFVDDLASNTRGARRAGLKTVTFGHGHPRWLLRLRLRVLGVPGV
jgi:putative hydrolase of the HAD superfamily